MKKLIIIIIALLAMSSARAQGCLPEGIIFSSQDQIDNFQENYPGCTEIEGDVLIVHSDLGAPIDNLEGLSVLTSIGADLWITNISLPNGLNGLNNLVSIGGDLTIEWTANLFTLQGLESLNFIGDSISLNWNYHLYSLSGLENLAFIGSDLTIAGNYSLSDCEAQGICNYLSNPAAAVNIYDNGNGCNNPPEVASGCGITLECLPYGNYYFLNQEEINDFQDDYSDCTELAGNVTIGNEVNNLMGLNSVTRISGNLDFWANNVLTSLSGLDNLTTIGGGLLIGFHYAGPDRGGMSSLSSLAALNNLTSIGGYLLVTGTAVTSLDGLDNIDAGSIGSLYISQNIFLSTCEVNSVCNYLALPDADVWISGNAHGCDSPEEVEAACAVGDGEPAAGSSQFAVCSYPNPTQGIVNLQFTVYNFQSISLKIYNAQGQEVAVVLDESLPAGEHTARFDVSGLPAGIYLVRLQAGRTSETTKMIVLK